MLEAVNSVNCTLYSSTWFATRCGKAHNYRKKKKENEKTYLASNKLLTSFHPVHFVLKTIPNQSVVLPVFSSALQESLLSLFLTEMLLPALAHCLRLSLSIYAALPRYRTHNKGQEAPKARNMSSKKSWATQRPQGCAWVCCAFKGTEVEKSSNIAGIRVLGRLPRSQEKQQTVNGTETKRDWEKEANRQQSMRYRKKEVDLEWGWKQAKCF